MFNVLGICLVVEKGGTVSLVLRYPSTAPHFQNAMGGIAEGNLSHATAPPCNPTTPYHAADTKSERPEALDLFYSLPSRVIAKLFRPKPPLCGRAMTLAVGDTSFCCRSILLNHSNEDGEGDEVAEGSASAENSCTGQVDDSDSLVLFSVVVALSPISRSNHDQCNSSETSIAVPVDSDVNPGADSRLPKLRPSSVVSEPAPSPEIDRVHRSLARLCGALHREELRCRYVSLQTTRLLKIRDDILNQKLSTGTEHTFSPSMSTSNIPYPASMVASSGSTEVPERRNNGPSKKNEDDEKERIIDESRQAMMEIMLSGCQLSNQSIENDNCAGKGGAEFIGALQGNLAQDLASTYHGLVRNADMMQSSRVPSMTTPCSEAPFVVFVNGHVAVPIEPLSIFEKHDSFPRSSGPLGQVRRSSSNWIRSYHTLFFRNSSPEEVLTTLPASFDAVQPMQKFLLSVTHFKSLNEIAVASAMPLQLALQLSAWLVDTGICIIAPVMSSSTRFALVPDGPKLLQELSLSYIQQFGTRTNIHMAVSILTSDGLPLGDILSASSSKRFMEERGLADSSVFGLRISKQVEFGTHPLVGSREISNYRYAETSSPRRDTSSPSHLRRSWSKGSLHNVAEHVDAVRDDILCSIAVWLRAHSCLVEIREYFVSIASARLQPPSSVDDSQSKKHNRSCPSRSPPGESFRQMSSSLELANSRIASRRDKEDDVIRRISQEELMFQLLLDVGCLSGRISTTALCWKTGIDHIKLRKIKDWGVSNRKLAIVHRVHVTGDDWGAP